MWLANTYDFYIAYVLRVLYNAKVSNLIILKNTILQSMHFM